MGEAGTPGPETSMTAARRHASQGAQETQKLCGTGRGPMELTWAGSLGICVLAAVMPQRVLALPQ